MIIEYEQEYLEQLYNNGKCNNKKYRFNTSVIKKYQKRIDTLTSATCIEDLFVFNSLNFEAMQGKINSFSIRIDYHYRLEFKVCKQGTENIVTVCIITDITNHYQ